MTGGMDRCDLKHTLGRCLFIVSVPTEIDSADPREVLRGAQGEKEGRAAP